MFESTASTTTTATARKPNYSLPSPGTNKWRVKIERIQIGQYASSVKAQRTTEITVVKPPANSKLIRTSVRLDPITISTPKQEASKWNARLKLDPIIGHCGDDNLECSDSESFNAVDDIGDFVHYYESAPAHAQNSFVEEQIRTAEAARKSDNNPSIQPDLGKEVEYVKIINDLQIRNDQLNKEVAASNEKLLGIKQALRAEGEQFSSDKSEYFGKLLSLNWLSESLQTTGLNKGPDNLSMAIESLEKSLKIIPNTDHHRMLETKASNLLNSRKFIELKMLLINTYKLIPPEWLNDDLTASFHHCICLSDCFHCVQLIQKHEFELAQKIYVEKIVPHFESNMNTIGSIKLDDIIAIYTRLKTFFEDPRNSRQGFDSNSYKINHVFAMWDWSTVLKHLSSSINLEFNLNYGFQTITPTLVKSKSYLFFWSSFFVDRMKVQKLVDIKISSIWRNQKLSDSLNKFLGICSDEQHSDTNVIDESPLNRSILPDAIPAIADLGNHRHIADAKILTSVSDPGIFALSKSLFRSVSDPITISESVETVESIQNSTCSWVMCSIHHNTKAIFTWTIIKDGESYRISPLSVEKTKRVPHCLKMYRGSLGTLYTVHAEYSELVLMNIENSSIIYQTQNLHRNIILQVELVPDELQDEKRHGGIFVISLAFDNVLKLCLIPTKSNEYRVVDRIHGSSNQVMTAFTIYKTRQGAFELAVYNSASVIKFYRIQERGTLLKQRQLNMDHVKTSSEINRIIKHPHLESVFALTASNDNRIFLIDSISGSVIRRLTARCFRIDKRSDVSFSPDGKLITCGCIGMQPEPPVGQRLAAKNYRRSRSVSAIKKGPDEWNIMCWTTDGKIAPTGSEHNVSRCFWMKGTREMLILASKNSEMQLFSA